MRVSVCVCASEPSLLMSLFFSIIKEKGYDSVIIGKDTRVSGYMLEAALQAVEEALEALEEAPGEALEALEEALEALEAAL